MQIRTALQSFLEPFLLFLSDDPLLRSIQVGLVALGAFVIFLVFFTTRDILLRTRSFAYMALCILLVALLPGIGFLLYLLIRPTSLLRQREQEALIRELADHFLERKNRSHKKSEE